MLSDIKQQTVGAPGQARANLQLCDPNDIQLEPILERLEKLRLIHDQK